MRAIDRPKTLKQVALEELRHSIMLGQLAPGERLVERKLAEQLQVSRTVVRECVRHLESEKLVSIIPNSGPVVATLSEAEIQEIYQLRGLLESEAVALCSKKIAEDDLNELKQLVSLIEKDLNKNRVIDALETTTQLYKRIFEIAQLSVSWDLIEQLNGRINQLRIRSLSTAARRQKGPDNLKELLDLVGQGKAKAAAKLCRDHVLQAMEAALA